MTYIVQQPGSNTNPTDRYRVLEMAAWLRHLNDGTPLRPDSEWKTYGEAQRRAGELNNPAR